MRRHIKRITFIVVGVLFVLLGFVGIVLPVLQGFLFLAIGLIFLSISSPRFRVWIESHTRRYPKVHAVIEKLERWIVSIVGPLDIDETNTGDKTQDSKENLK